MIGELQRLGGGTLEPKQMSLANGFALKTKVTRRAQFLAEMNEVVPWKRLLAIVEPHYPVAEQGRPRPPEVGGLLMRNGRGFRGRFLLGSLNRCLRGPDTRSDATIRALFS